MMQFLSFLQEPTPFVDFLPTQRDAAPLFCLGIAIQGRDGLDETSIGEALSWDRTHPDRWIEITCKQKSAFRQKNCSCTTLCNCRYASKQLWFHLTSKAASLTQTHLWKEERKGEEEEEEEGKGKGKGIRHQVLKHIITVTQVLTSDRCIQLSY